MSQNYTTIAAVKNYLKTEIAAGFEAQVTEYIAAVSERADSLAGHPIYDTASTTYKYDGNGLSELDIKPVHTITAVTVDDVAVTPVQYPLNSASKRYLKFELDTFTRGMANVEVTGTHCLKTAIPAQLKHACTILVAGMVRNVKDQSAGLKSEKIGEYSVSYATDEERGDIAWAEKVLQSYRPIAF